VANIRDVAALSGVSVGAVSRVLSQDPTLRVSEETRKRVIEAAESLQYLPSYAGRALRTSRSNSLALVLPEVTSAIVAELARRAEVAAADRGVNLVLARAARIQEDPTWLRGVVASGRVDGVILQLPDGVRPDEILTMIGEPVPIVLINSTDTGPISTIVFDEASSMRLAVEHLYDLGHRSVGFVGGTPTSHTGARRRAGFLAAATDLGLSVDPESVLELGYTGADGRRAGEALAAMPTRPTGLVVANVDAALGVLAEFHARDIRVPDDISIVALHDVWYADVTWPPITTVKAQLPEVGPEAVALLLDAKRGDPIVHRVVTDPPPRVMVRASTSAPRQA
jgi:LacI family transcriptional regulator